MMKTITEYQPLIFSRILRVARDRACERRTTWWNVAVVSVYCSAGFWFFVDTGFAPWNWQFWIFFAPFFIAAELLVGEINTLVESRRADVESDEADS